MSSVAPFWFFLREAKTGVVVAQSVKNLPAMQETAVRSLTQEDPLEKEIATHSSISCLGNSMDRGAWQATVQGAARVRHN